MKQIRLEPISVHLPSDPSRRLFCQSAALGALAALVEACGGANPAGSSGGSSLVVLNGTLANGVVTVAIDASSPLGTLGGVAFVQAGTTGLLVARTGQSSFTALNATCTHQACQITSYSGSSYICPCHGSQFSTNGQVLSGPATRNLAAYTTQFSGNVLTIGG